MEGTKKKYLPEFVYGAIDGTITTFAVTASVVGAGLSPAIILILGFANLLADGFSMAASNYLSEKANTSSSKNPLRAASVTFSAFVIVGAIPVLPYVGLAFFPNIFGQTFLISSIATAVAFVFIGTMKAIVMGESRLSAGVETLLIGGIAATIAYTVGYLLKSLVV